MPSIVGHLLGIPEDATIGALDSAIRDDGSPYGRSAPLPLPEVDFSLTAQPGELAANRTWPPARFGARQERLELYHDLWRGDLRKVMDVRQLGDHSVGAMNAFRRLTRFVADLLVREQPTVGAEGALSDGQVTRLAHSLIVNMIRSGGGYVLASSLNGQPWLRVVDPRYAFPTPDQGWLVVEPRITPGADVSTPNTLQVIQISANVGNISFIAGTPTGVGNQISVGAPIGGGADLGPTVLLPGLALPEIAENVMGTSWYEDLITVVVQHSRRMAANTRVLDGNSDPLLLLRGDLQNYTTLPGVPPSSAVRGADPYTIERNARVAKRLQRAGPLVLPDGIEAADYVTWDGQLEGSMAMLNEIIRAFRFLSGLPAALDSEGEIPSGMSLRRMFWQFDANVAPIFYEARATLTTALATYGLTLEWENVFEAVEGSPMADEREDVENEDAARRGENDT